MYLYIAASWLYYFSIAVYVKQMYPKGWDPLYTQGFIQYIIAFLCHIQCTYNFNENWYLEDFRPEECDSGKCDLKMAVAIFNMVAKTHKKFRSGPMLQLQRKLIFRGF
jgi:hypothetical protein